MISPGWILGLFGLLLLQPVEARGGESGGGEAEFDDEVGLLFSTQIQFGPDGIPLVTIGLMEEQASVSVSAPGGLSLSGRSEVVGQPVEREVRTRPGERWRFEVEEVTPAEVSYWCGVESIPFSRKDTLKQALELWGGRSERLQVFEVGSVFGIRGHVIDNRTYILGTVSFPTEAEAEAQAQEVFGRWGSRTFVHPHLDRRPTGRIRALDGRGTVVAVFTDLVRVAALGGGNVTVHRVEHAKGYSWHGFEDRRYAGEILVSFDRLGKLVVVNRIGVDRLLEGLVAAEIFPTAPLEALKAQAVVARGEVFAKIGTRHFLDPYLLCAATHCQVYAGVGAEHPRAAQAVRRTLGELLFLGPDLVDSVYSAMCGGHTEDNDAVWADPPSRALRGRPDAAFPPRPLPVDDLAGWLASRPPAYCRLSTFSRPNLFRWEKFIPVAQISSLVAQMKPIGQVVSIQVLDRGVSGRVKVVRVVGDGGELVVQREWPIRQLFGNLKRGMFVVEPTVDDDQVVMGFRFRGGGYGHGVGMCQVGAIGMAERGFDYREILAHYYNGAGVFRLYGAGQ